MKKVDREYLRSSLFGLEDALVSTTGAVVGISAGTADRHLVIVAAFVVVTVEAIAMGVGQFLSEETLYEAEGREGMGNSVIASAAVMLVSYFLAGLIPIVPYLLLPLDLAMTASVLMALVGLFSIGYIKGRIVQVAPVRSAIKMLLLGGIATIVGVLVGLALRR